MINPPPPCPEACFFFFDGAYKALMVLMSTVQLLVVVAIGVVLAHVLIAGVYPDDRFSADDDTPCDRHFPGERPTAAQATGPIAVPPASTVTNQNEYDEWRRRKTAASQREGSFERFQELAAAMTAKNTDDARAQSQRNLDMGIDPCDNALLMYTSAQVDPRMSQQTFLQPAPPRSSRNMTTTYRLAPNTLPTPASVPVQLPSASPALIEAYMTARTPENFRIGVELA